MVLVELLNTPGLSAAARPAGQRPARPSQDRSRPAGHRPTLQGSSSASAASVGKIFESQAAPGLEESLSSTGEMVIRPWPNLSDSCGEFLGSLHTWRGSLFHEEDLHIRHIVSAQTHVIGSCCQNNLWSLRVIYRHGYCHMIYIYTHGTGILGLH